MPSSRRWFYGWPLVVVAWVLYGFGVAPVFYGWSFFLPETLQELDLSRGQGGFIWGLYIFCGGAAAPLVGVALGRWGLRRVITAGFLVSSVGIFLTAAAQSALHLYLFFAIFTGATHGFATALPAQTLVSNWFLRYRARVMAIVLTAGGFVGPLVFAFDTWLLSHSTWRMGWVVVGALTVALGLLAAALVRNSPEDLGQLRDGAKSEEEVRALLSKRSDESGDEWTPREALRTPQFFLMVVCGLGYALPYYVLLAHSRLHLEDVGFETAAVAAMLSAMTLVSTGGRLLGALGDFISPPRLLGIALAIEAVGTGFFVLARSSLTAYLAVICVGAGFGMAYISQAATFSSFFGRQAFATTTGIRFFIGACFAATIPGVVGLAYDRTGSYTASFLGLAGLGLVGAIVALSIRAPRKGAASDVAPKAAGIG